MVEPGDVVLADDDGVVFASVARVQGALETIQKIIANEKRLKDPAALEQAMQGLLSVARVETP